MRIISIPPSVIFDISKLLYILCWVRYMILISWWTFTIAEACCFIHWKPKTIKRNEIVKITKTSSQYIFSTLSKVIKEYRLFLSIILCQFSNFLIWILSWQKKKVILDCLTVVFTILLFSRYSSTWLHYHFISISLNGCCEIFKSWECCCIYWEILTLIHIILIKPNTFKRDISFLVFIKVRLYHFLIHIRIWCSMPSKWPKWR